MSRLNPSSGTLTEPSRRTLTSAWRGVGSRHDRQDDKRHRIERLRQGVSNRRDHHGNGEELGQQRLLARPTQQGKQAAAEQHAVDDCPMRLMEAMDLGGIAGPIRAEQ